MTFTANTFLLMSSLCGFLAGFALAFWIVWPDKCRVCKKRHPVMCSHCVTASGEYAVEQDRMHSRKQGVRG